MSKSFKDPNYNYPFNKTTDNSFEHCDSDFNMKSFLIGLQIGMVISAIISIIILK